MHVSLSAELECLNLLYLQFYLLDDRLCYTDEPGTVEDVRYIPLDRIPVRALPRGYGPQIGVTVIEDRYQYGLHSMVATAQHSCNSSTYISKYKHAVMYG